MPGSSLVFNKLQLIIMNVDIFEMFFFWKKHVHVLPTTHKIQALLLCDSDNTGSFTFGRKSFTALYIKSESTKFYCEQKCKSAAAIAKAQSGIAFKSITDPPTSFSSSKMTETC